MYKNPSKPQNLYYDSAMRNVKLITDGGAQPSVSELIGLAKLEQLHRIANELEKRNDNELEKRDN